MKILVLISDFYPFDKPTAKLANRIIRNLSNRGIEIDVLSRGADFPQKKISKLITNYQIINYDLVSNFSVKKLFYKICRKFYATFGIWGLFDCRRLFKEAKKLVSSNKYDLVLSISGLFSAHEASSRIAVKYNIPLFLYYADPFSGSWVLKKKNQTTIHKIEQKWFENARCVFMPECYLNDYSNSFSKYKNKIVTCEFPGFFDDSELRIINSSKKVSKLVVYAGDFFPKFREPHNFIKLAESLTDYEFLVMGSLKLDDFCLSSIPHNIKLIGRLFGEDYLKKIGNASFLYLEDNSFPNQIPYKTFEYISTCRPIIYSTNNIKSATSEIIKHTKNSIVVTNFEKIDKNLFDEINNKACLDNTLSEFYTKYKTNVICDIIFSKIKEQLEIVSNDYR